MKRNTQGFGLSIIGQKENVQVNENFARPVKTADATDALNGSSAVSEIQSTKLGRKPVVGSATNKHQRFSSLRSGLNIMHGKRRGIPVVQHNIHQVTTRGKASSAKHQASNC